MRPTEKRALRLQASRAAAGASRAQALIKSPSAITFGLRGQASMELLVTVAFAVMMLVMVIGLAYLQMNSASDQLALEEAQQSVNKLKNVVDAVSAQGPPAKAIVEINIPKGISNITIGSDTPPYIGREIIFKVQTSVSSQPSDVPKTTLYDVTGDLHTIMHPGTYQVTVEVVDDCVGTGNPCAIIAPAP
ncbi:Uncharacterised protein [uncultured archaeon]|nr:Uncharacterised protein [uncultured archaeon]